MTKRGRNTGFGACVLVLLLAAPGFAQQLERDLSQEIEALKKGQQDIQRELQEIKKLLQTRRKPARNVRGVVFNLGDNPIKGEKTAKLTLIDFTDYQ
jgi:hypothetical protein